MKKRINVKSLTIAALMIALSIILGQIKVFQMPQGGSVTLFGLLPIVVLGYLMGTRIGLLGGLGSGLLQLLFGGYVIHPIQLILDYILATCCLGLSGLVRNKHNGLTKGYLIGITCKYICAVISGWVFFGSYAPENFNALLWSLFYNITYIGAEGIITVVLLNIPVVKKTFLKIRNSIEN